MHRVWQLGDRVELSLDTPVRQVKANSNVAADRGRVALMRGPVVYCFEGADNGGGVQNFTIPADASYKAEYHGDLRDGVTILTGPASGLYQDNQSPAKPLPETVTAIPSYANANRGACPMQVWMPVDETICRPQRQD